MLQAEASSGAASIHGQNDLAHWVFPLNSKAAGVHPLPVRYPPSPTLRKATLAAAIAAVRSARTPGACFGAAS